MSSCSPASLCPDCIDKTRYITHKADAVMDLIAAGLADWDSVFRILGGEDVQKSCGVAR